MAAVLLCQACGPRLLLRPPPEPLRSRQTDSWVEAVTELGKPGDWLVVRGYKGTDDLIVAATNIPLSHVAVLDREAGSVIEAVTSGVQVVELRHFLHHAHRLLLVRPKWWTPKRGHLAVRRARNVVGKAYDFLGTVGGGSRDRYYCSELALLVYEEHIAEGEHIPPVIEPGQMFLFGKVLHDTGFRDVPE